MLFGVAATAHAQTGAGVAWVSDERFRGVSLSNSNPAVRASLNYDHPSGWYVGGAAADVELDTQRRQFALFSYLGYAQRTASGLGWELGATAANFAVDSRYNYGEAFVGLIAQRWNARVYASPSYFGSGHATVYAEINGGLPLNQPLGRPLTLFGH
ncbi:MAG TPA: TorF family putative porin, partial [Burkholderiaceae bacterium]|nr:TorF family putative porin [Burkholderiaceae bacterium]